MEQAGPARKVTVELDVPARMRDGVTLRANVYRPDGEGPWPTLLTRTPYDKNDPLGAASLDPVQVARAGFMVVVQDTRGRFASEGQWLPFRFECQDGHDSVEWAARLPGSNGRVGMYGESYCGSTQWMAAVERPPSLAAIAPALTWSDPADGLLSRGGALELGLTIPWTLATGMAHLGRLGLSEQELERRLSAVIDDYDRLAGEGYWELPVQDMAVMRRHRFPELGGIRALDDAEVRDWCRVSGRHERVLVPTLNLGSWYDVMLQGTIDNYVEMAALGRPARLVIAPWTHLTFTDPIGEQCFGMRADRVGVPAHAEGDSNDLQLAWLRRFTVDDAAQEIDSAPVRIFVMGANEWRDESDWPLTRARPERWHLGAAGSLRRGEPGSEQGVSELVHDPADPVPTLGGQTVMAPGFPAGPFDQAQVEARSDVCVFTSLPLQQDLEVTGRVRVVLHAESSACSTDWVARLCDVHPDGRSVNLCDGIARIAQGADACRQVEIDLWSTSNVFLAGHRLRVHVTGSSFPRWDRNLSTGNQREPHFQAARQRVHHGPERGSWIELPVVP